MHQGAVHMNTVNVHNAIEAFAATLNESRNELINELEVLDQQRVEVVKQLGKIDQTLAALSGKPMPNNVVSSNGPGTRKPMSAEGKENIRKALEARRLRLAAEAGGKPTETVAVPEAATEVPSEPVQAPVVEAPAVAPAVKVTDLEKDVLVGGILKNNFQDGAEGTQSIWVNQIIDNGATKLVKAKQLPGVVASLSKKGLVSTDGEGITLTESGLALARGLANA